MQRFITQGPSSDGEAAQGLAGAGIREPVSRAPQADFLRDALLEVSGDESHARPSGALAWKGHAVRAHAEPYRRRTACMGRCWGTAEPSGMRPNGACGLLSLPSPGPACIQPPGPDRFPDPAAGLQPSLSLEQAMRSAVELLGPSQAASQAASAAPSPAPSRHGSSIAEIAPRLPRHSRRAACTCLMYGIARAVDPGMGSSAACALLQHTLAPCAHSTCT